MKSEAERKPGHSPDADGLAAALGRVPSGLFILTARHGSAETGMLVSWVQQCSFDPPQLSIAVGRDRAVSGWLVEGAALTLNILAEGQKALVAHFGKGFGAGEPAFTGLKLERPAGEAPVLADALAHLLCRVTGRCSGGDHDLVIARVVGGRVHADGRPTVHIRRSGLNY
jgi:flavin reductase (DIM6/NTAB) family NADH-FMN oxidoreductase RutF